MMARARSASASPIRFVALASVLSWLLALSANTGAQVALPAANADRPLERFLQHVRWPDEPDTARPWQLCVTGDATDTARHFQDVRARERDIVVVALDDPAQASACHLLDLRRVDTAAQRAWLDAVRGTPVLSIGRGREFCTRGGHICFLPDGAHPFEINLSAAQAAGLRISARVLARDPDGAPP